MILLTESEEVIRLLPERHVLCRIELCEKARKNDNKNGI